jgi:hypothetical protein
MADVLNKRAIACVYRKNNSLAEQLWEEAIE